MAKTTEGAIQSSPLQQKLRRLYIRFKKAGILWKIVLYILLIALGFVFLYPILYMLTNSFMNVDDLVNPTVQWLPTSFFFGNYEKALEVLQYGSTLLVSVFLVAISSVLQTASCALAGYAFARYEFRGKGLFLGLLLLVFLVPTQVMLVPKYLLFHNYGLLESPLALFVPAALGQGIKAPVFVLIFQQYFKSYPKSFDEAAQLDGAGRLRVFLRIAIPVCIPAFVVAFLFSFVWYWNETTQAGTLLGQGTVFGLQLRTLPMRLTTFVDEYNRLYPSSDGSTINKINESIRMAGTILTIAPLVALYCVLQRQFVEGIESSGITGE